MPKSFGPICRSFTVASLLALLTLLTGCVSMYVDTATKKIPVTEFRQPAEPKPVHVVFEFQFKGVPNPRATALLKDQVIEQVNASKLFVSTDSTNNARMLNITLNNVPINGNVEDAAAKGFVTGMTFGLVGTAITDGYICITSYLPAGQTQPITATARPAIHGTICNAAAPAGAIKAANPEAAARTMTREVLNNTLNSLSHDSQFN